MWVATFTIYIQPEHTYARNTAYQILFGCERAASRMCREKDVTHKLLLNSSCVSEWVCARCHIQPNLYMKRSVCTIHSLSLVVVVPSWTLCIHSVGHSCAVPHTNSYVRPNVLRIFGHRINLYAAATQFTFHMWTEWIEWRKMPIFNLWASDFDLSE